MTSDDMSIFILTRSSLVCLVSLEKNIYEVLSSSTSLACMYASLYLPSTFSPPFFVILGPILTYNYMFVVKIFQWLRNVSVSLVLFFNLTYHYCKSILRIARRQWITWSAFKQVVNSTVKCQITDAALLWYFTATGPLVLVDWRLRKKRAQRYSDWVLKWLTD